MAEFYGSARIGDPLWRGHCEIRPQLAMDVEWIELLGERVELTAQPAGTRTWAEPLPAQDPAVRHVWERDAQAVLAGTRQESGLGHYRVLARP